MCRAGKVGTSSDEGAVDGWGVLVGAKQQRGFSGSCPESDDCTRRETREIKSKGRRTGGREGGRMERGKT